MNIIVIIIKLSFVACLNEKNRNIINHQFHYIGVGFLRCRYMCSDWCNP